MRVVDGERNMVRSETDVIEAMEEAAILDDGDELRWARERFCMPCMGSGDEKIYLCGNSLGLMPKAVVNRIQAHLDKWRTSGVEGHFKGDQPWASIEDMASSISAEIVGAKSPLEVVYMNTLTVNLHLMMVPFYRPTPQRFKILIEAKAFPSDDYAVQSQVKFHGFDPDIAIIRLEPRPNEYYLRPADIIETINREKDSLALVLFAGVQYYTGQVLPMQEIVAACRAHNISVGLDLAHAVGNVPLHLHDWGVDFAVWCTYKYLNSGPGAVSGVFIHDRHAFNSDLPRFAGWWGYSRESRFEMKEHFEPQPGAYGFQLSNPPVLATVPVACSLEIFREAGIDRLREKSVKLTGLLERLLDKFLAHEVVIITPRSPDNRGCQISLRLVHGYLRKVHAKLEAAGVVCDTREPDVMRIAPVPLYNTFRDVVNFVFILATAIREVRESAA